MEQTNDKQYAVLTGDIVASSRLSVADFQSVKDSLKDASMQINHLSKSAKLLVVGGIDFYRGDGWQLLLAEPRYALRGCLFLRAYLRAWRNTDTRIAIGIGNVEHIDHNQVSESTGLAFELSGAALDKLKRRRRMMVIFGKQTEKSLGVTSVFELSDAIVQRWTQKQAEAMLWALKGFKQVEIAKKLNKKQQAVGKALNSSGWYAIEPVLGRLEENEYWKTSNT